MSILYNKHGKYTRLIFKVFHPKQRGFRVISIISHCYLISKYPTYYIYSKVILYYDSISRLFFSKWLLNIQILTVTSFWKSVIDTNMVNFRLKIIVMAIFTEISSFRLNVVQDPNVVRDTKCHMWQSFILFLWGTDWVHNQNMCFLDWVCRLIRKYKLPVSFKAATPCSINKCP